MLAQRLPDLQADGKRWYSYYQQLEYALLLQIYLLLINGAHVVPADDVYYTGVVSGIEKNTFKVEAVIY